MKRTLRFFLTGACLVAPLIATLALDKSAYAQSPSGVATVQFVSPQPSTRPDPESTLPPNATTIGFETTNSVFVSGLDSGESISVDAVAFIKVDGSEIEYTTTYSPLPTVYQGLKHANSNGEYSGGYTLRGTKGMMTKQMATANGNSTWTIKRVKDGPNGAPVSVTPGSNSVSFYTGIPVPSTGGGGGVGML